MIGIFAWRAKFLIWSTGRKIIRIYEKATKRLKLTRDTDSSCDNDGHVHKDLGRADVGGRHEPPAETLVKQDTD